MEVSELNLADGEYTVEVTMEGGSGRASVQSPTELLVENGQAAAKIVWSSSHYDYMKVGEEKYLPVNTEGNSTFEIPVEVFDEPMSVIGDTTAMSVPHEIEYTLTFASDSVEYSGHRYCSSRCYCMCGGILGHTQKQKEDRIRRKDEKEKHTVCDRYTGVFAGSLRENGRYQ